MFYEKCYLQSICSLVLRNYGPLGIDSWLRRTKYPPNPLFGSPSSHPYSLTWFWFVLANELLLNSSNDSDWLVIWQDGTWLANMMISTAAGRRSNHFVLQPRQKAAVEFSIGCRILIGCRKPVTAFMEPIQAIFYYLTRTSEPINHRKNILNNKLNKQKNRQ